MDKILSREYGRHTTSLFQVLSWPTNPDVFLLLLEEQLEVTPDTPKLLEVFLEPVVIVGAVQPEGNGLWFTSELVLLGLCLKLDIGHY